MKGEEIMVKKIGIIGLLGLFIFVGMAVSDKTESQAETYNWKMSSPYPPGDDANQRCDVFGKLIEERSNGRVKMTVYQGTLGSPRDAWDMVKTNAVQFTWTGDLYNPGRMPITQLVALPFEVPNVKMAYNILNEFLDAGYLKEFDDFKPLYFLPTYPIGLYTTKKKITKLEDFKGMKIRCGTGLQGQALISLGASTVSLPGSEEYMALQTGVIDGTITGINIGIHRKLNEVCKYAIKEPPLFYGVLLMLMNKKTWESTPPDLQKIIVQTAHEIAGQQIESISSKEDEMWKEFGQKVDCYSISPAEQARWRKTVEDLGDKHAAELSEKGYPGKEALALMRKILNK
jgi:TRAP-type C4-dicarboxylate transport system substrate-binding protein